MDSTEWFIVEKARKGDDTNGQRFRVISEKFSFRKPTSSTAKLIDNIINRLLDDDINIL